MEWGFCFPLTIPRAAPLNNPPVVLVAYAKSPRKGGCESLYQEQQ